jgi:hypothetical protein
MPRRLAVVLASLVAIGALTVVALDPLHAERPTLEVGHVKAQSGDNWGKIARRLSPPGVTDGQVVRFARRIRLANGGPGAIVPGQILHYDVADVPTIPPWRTSSTSTSSTAAPTTTSTLRPPASSTSTATSMSTTSTTASVPPSGDVLFFEDFTGDSIGDFTSRFDWSVADLGRKTDPWQGHHDMACSPPTMERTLHHGTAYDNVNPGAEFWLCGPPAVADEHLMTSNGSNSVFGITAFSPKGSYTGNRVCWDVNLTESFGRRLWWEVELIPTSYVTNAQSLVQMGTSIASLDSERGTAYLAWGAGVNGTFMNRVVPTGALIWDFTEEKVQIWRGNEPNPNAGWGRQAASVIFFPGYSWETGVRYVTQDRATRAHHCWVDNGNGTMTITQQRPGQADYVRTIQGSFPKPYRPIFQAHNYNAGKDGTESNQTWHWDNILVTSS